MHGLHKQGRKLTEEQIAYIIRETIEVRTLIRITYYAHLHICMRSIYIHKDGQTSFEMTIEPDPPSRPV